MTNYPRHPLPLYRAAFDSAFQVDGEIQQPGDYLFDSVTLSMALQYRPANGIRTHVAHDLTKPPLVMFMPGAHGDLLFLTPLLATLSDTGAKVACLPRFAPILRHVAQTIDIPVPYTPDLGYTVNLSHLTERPEVLGRNVIDAVFEMVLGRIPNTVEEGKIRYVVTDEERLLAEKAFPRNKKYRLGVQLAPSCISRYYPDMAQVMKGVVNKIGQDIEVIILAPPGEAKVPPALAGICRSTSEFNMDIRQSAAVLSTCDALLGPDSVMAHIAGALDIPTIVPMATFTREERFKYAPSVFVVRGDADCAPCRHHLGDRFGKFPLDCSIPNTGYCKAMTSISPERVITAVIKALKAP